MLQRLKLTTEEYFALPYASNSGIKEADKLMHGRDTEYASTPAYEFGSALDAYITDPLTLDTSMLTSAQRADVLNMNKAISANTTFKALFENYTDTQAVFVDTEFEVTFDGITVTIPGKCKFDWWNNMLGFGGDLKTTMAKDEKSFISAAKWFNYDQQAAWYMDITKSDRFVIIACSKINYHTFTMSFRRWIDRDRCIQDPYYLAGKAKYEGAAGSWWKLYGQ